MRKNEFQPNGYSNQQVVGQSVQEYFAQVQNLVKECKEEYNNLAENCGSWYEMDDVKNKIV